ncbi:MAG TPA: aminotransferase class I/II-fold pyridoxal phosphate-dependent enzyme, partial [Agromyces sp.]|nr:aminotransferase class I/II-fold pyridoxal phosphate-dependent enzyme [Agromyces sp.]
HLVFPGASHVPLATLPGMAERTLTISSGGKTFNTTGWKIGWVTGPDELVTAVLAVKQYLTFVNGAPFQPAIAAGLDLADRYFAEAASSLAAKRDVLLAGLDAAGFAASVPSAGYFVVADAAALGATDAQAFCRELPHRAGVVGVPVSAFVHPERRDAVRSLVRFAFCKRRDVLEEASARLAGL